MSRDEVFFMLNTFFTIWPYWPHPFALTIDIETKNFFIYVEGYVDIITMHLVFLKCIWE